MKKVALITGITGQDGSFLAEFLIEKGYEVHGILRRSSSFNTGRIEHLYLDEWVRDMKQQRLVNLHYGDMTDSSSLIRIIQQVQPDEIYNLAAQSHVKVSLMFLNIRQKLMLWVLSVCWKRFVFLGWKRKQRFIRLPLLSCLAKYRRSLKRKRLLFIHVVRMALLSSMVLDY